MQCQDYFTREYYIIAIVLAITILGREKCKHYHFRFSLYIKCVKSSYISYSMNMQSSSSHCVYSWMGRAVLDFPLEEIASFIADPDSAILFDKHITVSYTTSLGCISQL